jgi:hypothetical protein
MRAATDLAAGFRGGQAAALIFASGRAEFYAFQDVNLKSIVSAGEVFFEDGGDEIERQAGSLCDPVF